MAALMNSKQPGPPAMGLPPPPHHLQTGTGTCFTTTGRYSPTYRTPGDPMRRHCMGNTAGLKSAAAFYHAQQQHYINTSQKTNADFMVKTEATDSWTPRKLQLMEEDSEAQNRRWRCLAAAPRFHYADMSPPSDDPDARYRMQNLGNFFPGLEEAGLMGRAEALADISKHSPPIKHDMSASAMYHAAAHHGSPMGPAGGPTSRAPTHGGAPPPQMTMDSMELLDPLCPSSLPPLGMTASAASSATADPTALYSPMQSMMHHGPGGALTPHHHHHHHHSAAAAAAAAVVAGMAPPGSSATDSETDPRELEAFAERFKQRRIKLGVTQADVGRALANLRLPGVGSLSQSTICRFESLTLSHNNMVALKPILGAWLEAAEAQAKNKRRDPDMPGVLPAGEKKRKRTSIAAPEKRSLEAYFTVQPRPSGEKIAAIAEKLDLKKNVVRVWFCNQRQKQKRMKYSAAQH